MSGIRCGGPIMRACCTSPRSLITSSTCWCASRNRRSAIQEFRPSGAAAVRRRRRSPNKFAGQVPGATAGPAPGAFDRQASRGILRLDRRGRRLIARGSLAAERGTAAVRRLGWPEPPSPSISASVLGGEAGGATEGAAGFVPAGAGVSVTAASSRRCRGFLNGRSLACARSGFDSKVAIAVAVVAINTTTATRTSGLVESHPRLQRRLTLGLGLPFDGSGCGHRCRAFRLQAMYLSGRARIPSHRLCSVPSSSRLFGRAK